MPTLAWNGTLVQESYYTAANAMLQLVANDSDSDGDERAMLWSLAASEPFTQQKVQTVGREKLSLRRLNMEHGRAVSLDAMVSSVYSQYSFQLEHLPRLVAAINLPDRVVLPRQQGGHAFTGEEATLLLLRRFVSKEGAEKLGQETGRSDTAMSEIIEYAREWILSEYPYLVDARSLTDWAQHFPRFAANFSQRIPCEDLIGFIDGKLWPTCKPVRNQHEVFNGHKRRHGSKTQGMTLANGIQPYPFVMPEGVRHDAEMLLRSQAIPLMQQVCAALNSPPLRPPPAGAPPYRRFCWYTDTAYPLSPYMLTPYALNGGAGVNYQQLFNSVMSTERIQAEWGFGKIINLFSYLDYSKNLKLLKTSVAQSLQVGNLLTNMHTCLYGSIISQATGLDPPSLEDYMSRNF